MRRINRIIAGTGYVLAALVCAAPEIAQTQQESSAVLNHLNTAIHWYKDLTTRAPAGIEPSDSIYLSNAKTLGAQVVRLAFQSARAQASLNEETNATNKGGAGQNANAASGATQRYTQIENQVQQRIADDESKLNILKSGSKHVSRDKSLAEQQSVEGKLELDKATLAAVQQMRNFAENTSTGATGLEKSIDELARSVVEVLEPGSLTTTENTSNKNNATNKPTKTSTPAAKSETPARSGLLGELVTLYNEMQSIRSTIAG